MNSKNIIQKLNGRSGLMPVPSEQGIEELMLDLEEIGLKISDPETKKQVLEAMAEPVVKEAKRITRPGGMFGKYRKTGNLSKSIGKEWSPDYPDEIKVGWGEEGFYGKFHERGFFNKQYKVFIKNPHIRPAFESKRSEVGSAGIKKYKEILGG